jgi:phage-related protein
MAIIALPYVNKISILSSKGKLSNDTSIQYKEGFQQVIPHGINTARDTWTINWAGLTLSEKQSLETTFDTKGSWGIYSYTPCYENNIKNYRMEKDSYSLQIKSNSEFNISAKFTQVFDLDSA